MGFEHNEESTKEKRTFETTMVAERKLSDSEILDRTFFKKIEEEEGNISNELRLEKFKSLSPVMREALSVTGTIFKEAKLPWAIHGSTSLVLEGETHKKPDDIDLAFADVDFKPVLAKFQELEKEGKLKGLNWQEMSDFKGVPNGCMRIEAEIITSEGTINIEAFAQNVDTSKKPNGISNIGLETMGVNVYNENGVEINFANREENFKFYLQMAAIELQKYQLDNSFMHKIKNKFPQRLNNIIAILKRQQREDFEKKLKEGLVTEEERPNPENITDKDITKLMFEFEKYNLNPALFDKFAKSTDAETIDPVDTLFKRFVRFQITKESKLKEGNETEGFIKQKGDNREDALDVLTQEGLMDMTEIAKNHKQLQMLQKEFDILFKLCAEEDECDEDDKIVLNHKKRLILKKTGEVLGDIKNKRSKYEGYLEMINYTDNRDFIPYVAIQETLNRYIIPSIELAIALEQQIEQMKELI
ncbi:MAG: hypothetical protein AAB438_01850 [Patescibacteria group bacterium]